MDPSATLTEPTASAPLRCDHAEHCAGCTALDEAYAVQLQRKRDRVLRAFARYPALTDLTIATVRGAQTTESYRPRAKLVVASQGSIGSIGLFARDGSHRVVDIPNCRVLSPPLAAAAAAMRTLVRNPPAGLELWLKPTDGGGVLRAIDLREVVAPESPPRVMITLVLDRYAAGARLPPAELSAEIQAAVPAFVTLAISWHAGQSAQVLGGVPAVVAGESSVRDGATSRVWIRAVPGGFVQAHRAQAAQLYDRASALLTDALGDLTGRHVIDAYAGAGAMGLDAASRGAKVDLIESVAPAAVAAQSAADEQGLTARAVAGDVETVISEWASAGVHADAVVLNPPRRGVAPAVREAVARLRPDAVVYVSCEPESLARDLDHFARLGYRTRQVEPFDFMPQTHEVESLVLLRRAQPIAPTVIAHHDDALFFDKPPHEPIAPHRERGASLLERARVARGEPSLTSVQMHADGTSGVCLVARDPDAAAAWTRALASASSEQTYLALVRGMTHEKGSVRQPSKSGGSMASATRYRRIAIVSGHSLLRVTVVGGRSQQVRQHLARLGHPVLGDDRLGHAPSNRHFAERYGLDRTFLHCERVLVPGPRGMIDVSASVPGDLASVLARMDGPTLAT